MLRERLSGTMERVKRPETLATCIYMKGKGKDVKEMSETLAIPLREQSILNDLILDLRPFLEYLPVVKAYAELAKRLSQVVHKVPVWGWRYVQGVHTGSIEPSRKMVQAVEILSASRDGIPADVLYTEKVGVYAEPGTVRQGSLILARSIPCKCPTCKVWFVPRTPNQKFHHPRCGKEYKRLERLEAWYAAHPHVRNPHNGH